MDDAGIAAEYPVIKAMYSLVLEVSKLVKDFPRDSRFILGDRILTNCYEVLEGLIEARYSKKRAALLWAANLRLEKLRYQIRLCLDTKIISAKQYGRLAEAIDQVGRMVGGWLKQSTAETGRSRMRRPGVARGLVEQQQSEELPRLEPEQQQSGEPEQQ